MAQVCPEYTYRQLAWIADWYVRDETCRQGLASIINAQHRHPFAAHWGDGTTSSSDAQQFSVGGRSASIGQVNAHYGTEPGVKLYTHLSDQYGPYHSTTISATASEAPYLVDGLLYHETDLEIAEYYSDTGAFTDQMFGICHLLGFRYAVAGHVKSGSSAIPVISALRPQPAAAVRPTRRNLLGFRLDFHHDSGRAAFGCSVTADTSVRP